MAATELTEFDALLGFAGIFAACLIGWLVAWYIDPLADRDVRRRSMQTVGRYFSRIAGAVWQFLIVLSAICILAAILGWASEAIFGSSLVGAVVRALVFVWGLKQWWVGLAGEGW